MENARIEKGSFAITIWLDQTFEQKFSFDFVPQNKHKSYIKLVEFNFFILGE